jgi:hypothetical protein
MTDCQELARRYMTRCVHLWAAVAFGDGQIKLWTRPQASRLLGAFPEPVPSAPAASFDSGREPDA